MCSTCWGLFQTDPDKNELLVKNVKPRDFEPCAEFRITGRPYLNDQGYFQITGFPGFVEPYNPQQERGKKGGRPKTDPELTAEVERQLASGKSLREVANATGIPRSTVSDIAAKRRPQ